MTDTTPEVVMLTDNAPELAKVLSYRAYGFDHDPHEAVAAFLHTFGSLPERIFVLRKQVFIEEPEGE